MPPLECSVGFFYSAGELLSRVQTAPLSGPDLIAHFTTVLVCPPSEVLNLSLRCGWIKADEHGMLSVSDRGHQLLVIEAPELRLRAQLRDYVKWEQPVWAKLLTRGRSEATASFHDDIKQVFSESGLLVHPITDPVVEWWDDVASSVRQARGAASLQVGRAGERLSLEYERRRTQRTAEWKGFESNFAGFDVLSVVGPSDNSPLRIEVKASREKISAARLHLSRNEWEVAVAGPNHVLHLWAMGAQNRLATIGQHDLRPHIPDDNGRGRWESVEIPFSAFALQFVQV